MKKIGLFALTLCWYFSGHSQAVSDSGIVSITRATFFGPGISHELPAGRFKSLYLHALLSIEAAISYSSTFGFNNKVVADPTVTVQHRFYYNFSKRSRKGKPTLMNNLNYVAPVYQLSFSKRGITRNQQDETTRRAVHVVGAVWGLQRNYHSRFSLDLALGIGYAFAKETKHNDAGERTYDLHSSPTGIANISMGFWLNRRTPGNSPRRR